MTLTSDRRDAMTTLAVIGGGLSGVLVAVHLLRGAAEGTRIVLVNRSGPTARGLAYGTRSERHLLNVPAGRMSAFPDDEEHFLRFARERVPEAGGGTFLPRRLYGDYLDRILMEAIRGRRPGVRFEHRVASAVTLAREAAGDARVLLDDGSEIAAARVILALGNFAPADPGVPARAFFSGSARYIADPWAPGALDRVAPGDRVLLVGTGLTMIDVALELGARASTLTAVSRRGLVPHPHRSPATPPPPPVFPARLLSGPPTVRAYLRALREQAADDAARGTDWRETVGAIRHITPALWQRLPTPERARFLRHLLPYWDVHRHRAAPAPAATIEALRAEGRLTTRAARLVHVEEAADGVEVVLRPRGAAGEERLSAEVVVNCTGPAARLSATGDRLVGDLLRKGLLTADPLGIGVLTDASYAPVDADGCAAPELFYVGPFLRASHWESTAAPELRVHAARAAAAVLRSLAIHA